MNNDISKQKLFFLTGFAGFLCLVINRMVSLISKNATLKAEKEAALKQAEGATRAAQSVLDSGNAK